jgi:hypothetical protein
LVQLRSDSREWEGNEKVAGERRVSEKQAFGVLVRAIGVLVFLEGLRTFWFGFWEWGMRGTSVGTLNFAIVGSSLVYGVFAIVLGATMIRWPDWVVHLAWLERLPTIGRMTDNDNQSKSD